MIPIRQSIDVDATVAVAEEQWPRFMEWVLVGPHKLACDQLVCVDPTASGVVRFEDHDGHARVTFAVEVPTARDAENGDGAAHEIELKLLHDLLLFKDYIANGAQASGAAAHEVAQASLRKEKRHGRLFPVSERGSDPGLTARPSSRAR